MSEAPLNCVSVFTCLSIYILHSLIQEQSRYHNLIPKFINAQTGRLRNDNMVTLGARADSYYEYLFKLWLQSGKKEGKYVMQN